MNIEQEPGRIILDQLQTMERQALWAWGAHKYMIGKANKEHNGYLVFVVVNCPNVPQNTRIKITLEYNDTYTVKAYKARKVRGKMDIQEKVFCEATDVYVETLIETIDRIVG